MRLPLFPGRGAQSNPANRFTRLDYEREPEFAPDGIIRTEYFADDSRSIVTENSSPDVPFRFSVNPYRGCLHGCSYCFARPTHEYFGLSAGLDFETRIFVKRRAPELFRDWLMRPKYQPESIAISGVTDCYQPIEKDYRLTRGCLEVALEARQPIGIITKNALVERDLDLLQEMARHRIVRVCLSVTTLDQSLQKLMEPRTASPAARLRVLRTLSDAGIPTHAMIAPVIPGLTDHEIPALLQAVREAGVQSVSYILLRLPGAVEGVFLDWLRRARPECVSKVESRIRATRGGKLYDSTFGRRMTGQGEFARQIAQTFELFARRLGLSMEREPLDASQFRRPVSRSQQLSLFN